MEDIEYTKEFLDTCEKAVRYRLNQLNDMINTNDCEICKYMQYNCSICPVYKECIRVYTRLIHNIRRFLIDSLKKIKKLKATKK